MNMKAVNLLWCCAHIWVPRTSGFKLHFTYGHKKKIKYPNESFPEAFCLFEHVGVLYQCIREADSTFGSTLSFFHPAAWVHNHLYSLKHFMIWQKNTAKVTFMWCHKGLFSGDVWLWPCWDCCERNSSSVCCLVKAYRVLESKGEVKEAH